MKKLELFSASPDKEIRISNCILWVCLVLIVIFGFSINYNYLTKNQALLLLGVWFAITGFAVFSKIRGLIKKCHLLKKGGHKAWIRIV